jgi:uncharacterized membrane protein YkvA (DUF1232 family)
MEQVLTQEQALVELEKGYDKAEKVLRDKPRFENILEKVEKKLKAIPEIGDKLSHIPVFIQLLKSYFSNEYREIPMGTVLAIMSALVYFASPIDLIPDVIPIVGYADDAAVVVACLSLVDDDVKEFIEWRDSSKNIVIVE